MLGRPTSTSTFHSTWASLYRICLCKMKYKIDFKEFNEYNVMIEVLKNQGRNHIRDLAFEKFEGHPVTFGDG